MIEDVEALIASELRESAEVKMRAAESLVSTIAQAAGVVERCLRAGNKILLAGNGGSAADAQHIATEFTGRFVKERPGLAAIALTTDTSALTAIGNDYGYDQVFRRQIEALGRAGDVLIVSSTSGNSPNVVKAVEEARKRGIYTIGLLGKGGGTVGEKVDLPIIVASNNNQRIQECHIAIGHALCAAVEAGMYGE